MKRAPLKRKSRLKPVSSKRAKELREYSKRRKVFLATHPFCECCLETGGYTFADDLHHKNGRMGAMLLETKFFMAVCRVHHDFIHSNPNASRKRGWLV